MKAERAWPRRARASLVWSATLAACMALAAVPAAAQGSVDLTGQWLFKGDWVESGLQEGWQDPDHDDSAWRPIEVPGAWEEQGITTNNPRYPAVTPEDGYNGVAWYRRGFTVPAEWGDSEARLRLGKIDDRADVYLNGQHVGSTQRLEEQRAPHEFAIAAGVLKPGAENVIAVRVLDTGGDGGIVQGPVELVQGGPQPEETATARHRRQSDMVRVGGSVQVPADTVVEGDVVAVGGSADVRGHVKGDVVAVGGSVYARAGSRVEGDATAVGGRVQREPGAELGGSVVEVPVLPSNLVERIVQAAGGRPRAHWWPFGLGRIGWLGRARSFVGTLVLYAFISLIAVLVFPRRLEVMARALPAFPGHAAAYGIGGFVLALPAVAVLVVAVALVSVVLVITVVGILVLPAVLAAIPAALLGLVVVLALGVAAVWLSLGRGIANQTGRGDLRAIWAALLGAAVVAVAAELPAVGPLVVVTVLIFGFGAALMTGVGSERNWTSRRLGMQSASAADATPAEEPSPAPEAGQQPAQPAPPVELDQPDDEGGPPEPPAG